MSKAELIRQIRQWRREHGYASSSSWALNIVLMLKAIGLIEFDNEMNVRVKVINEQAN